MKSAYPQELSVEPVAWRTTWCGRRSRILVTKAQARQEREERILDTLTELCRRRHKKGGAPDMPEQFAVKLRKLPDRLAALAGQTFAVKGAAAFESGIADDQFVSMVIDYLEDLDPGIIARNKNKSLARLRRVS